MSSSTTTTTTTPLPVSDVSLSYLLSAFRIENVTYKTETGDVLDSTLPGNQGQEEVEETATAPLVSYVFSNLASKTVFDMLANGAEPGSDVQNSLLFHSHGKPLDRVNEIYPYTFEFLDQTGNAGGPKISLSRAVWVHQSIALKPDFENIIKTYFTPELRTEFANTEAVQKEVKEWAEETSGGLLDDALGNHVIRDGTRVILAASLRFEGEWFEPFDDAGVQDFTFLNGQVVKMPFMSSTRKHYVQQYPNYKVLNVPFKQHTASRFSMLFYLTDNVDDIEEFQEFIGVEESVYHAVYFPEEQVQVGRFLIPKFELRVRGPLPINFDFNQMAETSTGLVSPGGRLCNFLKVDETGVKAAGFTTFFVDQKPQQRGKIDPSSFVGPPVIDFVANRPFLFFIRDNEFGRMCFSGALINPVDSSAYFTDEIGG